MRTMGKSLQFDKVAVTGDYLLLLFILLLFNLDSDLKLVPFYSFF